jgi:predicted nucleic acid-binding protein
MYVVDTNIVNWLVDGRIKPGDLPTGAEFLATHVQRDELAKTKDEQRCTQLLATFRKTINREVPTESMVAGISVVGLAKVSDGKLYYSLKAALDDLNKGKRNNGYDALIGEVAIQQGWMLLTADRDLAAVASGHGCKVQLFAP